MLTSNDTIAHSSKCTKIEVRRKRSRINLQDSHVSINPIIFHRHSILIMHKIESADKTEEVPIAKVA